MIDEPSTSTEEPPASPLDSVDSSPLGDESGVILSEPTAFLTGDVSSFHSSLFSVDTSSEVVRIAKRRSIRRGIFIGVLIGFPTMLLMFGLGIVESDWIDERRLTFTTAGTQKKIELQNEADFCNVNGNVYDMVNGGRDWFSSSLHFESSCDGNLHLKHISVLSDLAFSNGSAILTHTLPFANERCEISLDVRASSNKYSSISAMFYDDFDEDDPGAWSESAESAKCEGESVLIASIYSEDDSSFRELNIGVVNIEADVLTLSVNQTNISSLGNGQKEAKISISFIGWWEDSDVSEPGPVVGYIDGSTLRFTSSTTLDIFTSPFVDVDYRVQGAGMSGDEADLTQGIMWMMMNSLCCLGLFIIPLAGSLKMKDKPFAISQFLTMIPFIFIGWIGLASSGM